MDFIRLYGYLVTICLLVEGLLNARLLKHRKIFNVRNEVMISCLNSFIPIWNVITLIHNILLICAKEDTIKAVSVMLDVVDIDKED